MTTTQSPDPYDITIDLDELERTGLAVGSRIRISWGANIRPLVKGIEDTVEKCLDRLIAAVNDADVSVLIDRVKDRRSKLPLSSEIYSEVVGVCKQILAFSAAGFAFSLGFADKVVHLAPPIQRLIVILGIFYLELTATSIIVLLLYLAQARFRYPFLDFQRIGNSWPFFYYGSISDDVPRSPFQSAQTRIRAMTSYTQDFLRLATRALQESPRQQLRVELQQYFLLMSYMGYVHQFSLRLTNTFFYGLIGSISSLLMLTILGALA